MGIISHFDNDVSKPDVVYRLPYYPYNIHLKQTNKQTTYCQGGGGVQMFLVVAQDHWYHTNINGENFILENSASLVVKIAILDYI